MQGMTATMRIKSIILALSSLCISSVSVMAHAENYYSNAMPPAPHDGGYSSSGNNPGYASSGTSPQYPAYNNPGHPRKNKHVQVSVNFPSQSYDHYYVEYKLPKRAREARWVETWQGNPIPPYAVAGGHQPQPPFTLYVCRGDFRGGTHPGKILNGKCHISWGGNEISLSRYQVLASRIPLSFAPAGNGYLPMNAIQAGHENGGPLYACQAQYRGGLYPGKVIGNTCHIALDGREINIPYYNVLVR